ncbi:MAG: AMP-binding protein [Planctomycetes bacterium]|nr:AMP-binding protein [Planctomycetota bacterium]
MLLDALLDGAARFPHRPAVTDAGTTLSYRRLTLLARVLRDVVLQDGDCPRVGIMLPASTAFPAAVMGAWWAARIAVPLNFLLSAEELARIVADADLQVVLTVRHFAPLVSRLPVRPVFLEDLPLKRRALGAMLRPWPARPTVDPHATAVILYTSGTTAQPKGVELTFHNLHSNCVDTIASLDIDPAQKFLNILPPFHVFGLTANVLVPIVLGAGVFAIPRFNPLAVVKAVREQGITIIMAIPSMYAAMLRTKSSDPDTFRSLYLAVSGGEPLPETIRLGFLERFGLRLHQGYGLTETSPVVAACSLSAFREGTVGRPIRHVQVRIVGSDGHIALPGHDGEILVRGPGVMKGYFRKPEETRAVLNSDGWFSTGDIGHLDGDGFLVITGRAKEMLIIGGENVFAREIEAVLEAHASVLQAAVIGVPDELRGEAPVAFVVPQRGVGVSEADLRAFAKQSLAGFKVPKRIEIREDLPTGPTGKLVKRKLRELL